MERQRECHRAVSPRVQRTGSLKTLERVRGTCGGRLASIRGATWNHEAIWRKAPDGGAATPTLPAATEDNLELDTLERSACECQASAIVRDAQSLLRRMPVEAPATNRALVEWVRE